MKTLVIAEKPDMGRNIAAAIEPRAANKRSYLEGERYIITWAIGHLITLAEPDHYDDKYKKWNLAHLPIIPENFKLIPNAKTKDQLNVIADLAKRCDRLVNACDAGREGQHIFSLIQRYLKLTHPVQRLWISDLTPETIRAGFASLKDAAEYENLTKAAKARSEADWLIGMNGSRAFTTKHNVLLSVGRVQTPVLALVYDRQIQIEAFGATKYYEVHAIFEQGDVMYKGVWQGERLHSREAADKIAAKTSGKPGRIESYEVKDTKEYPYRLFDLTLLQRETNAKYGFSAKKTLDVAQALYEKHKVISYPRTNSNYVNEQNIPEMHRALDALRGTAYDALVAGASKRFVHKGNPNVCNPSKVEDHHAILPTHKRPGTLTPDEQKVYDLIVRRFLSHFYPAAEYKQHTVLTEVEQERFKTSVKQLLDLGWKVVYADLSPDKKKPRGKAKDDEEEDEAETDAPFSIDATAGVKNVSSEVKEKETQPPKPFTEGTLLKAMESAGKQIEDDELREAMKDSGLGTPATRAATIERLKQVEYIEMQGKRIVITKKGRMAIELIRGAGVELLASPEMTGHWERRLTEISRGTAADEAFMAKVKQFAAFIVDKVRMSAGVSRSAFESERPAPRERKPAAGSSSGAKKPRAASPKTAKAGSSASPAGTATATVAAPSAIGVCPRDGCGGTIFMGRKGYGCSHYKTGCTFVIWKESFGRTLTDAMVRSLIEKGRTSKLKWKDERGEPIEARIVLKNSKTGELELES
ncbi:DNA topoisomerase III [Paenibacillus antri]|uniref:DNA topoisomerase n=1 Tax=Paenibacillus antri TaxID=2582848 RepID=A0A5R9G837_9BACL|nr:type IA DNA topoisomerase [Paenibacillus antri]TLS52562.1 DNA topoisomerase III [Paenibacillus antri]